MNACLLFLATTVSLHVLSILKVTGNDRYHQPGDVTLGGLFLLHYTTEDGQCGKFFPIGLGHVEAMIFAIHKINSDPFLLPNITLGFEIRDYCESAAKAMEHTYDFVRLNEILTEAQNASCKQTNKKNITQSEEKPITAVVGPTDSGSAVLVASLLRVGGVPVISHSATSNELSSPLYRHFFRTAPPDGQQASAMADLIEHFNWSYVAAVAMDDSYGRNGVWKLESEADYRKTFCLSFAEYIPRQEYIAKLKRAVSKLKSHPNIRVVVLWLFGGYGRRFLKEAVQQNLVDRTWILSDALATEDDVFVGLKRTDQKILHGSLGLQPRMLDNKDFKKFLVNESLRLLNVKQVPWWQEFWKSEDSRHCSSLTVLSEQKYCIQIVLRTIYDTYIPYVVDAVYAIAHALHELINNCSRLGCEKSTKTGSGVFPSLSSRYVEDFLRDVNFTGMTGQVRFDKFGDPLGSSYDIVHFKTNDTSNSQDPVKLVIGSWEKNRKNKLQLNSNNIRWNTISSQGFVPKSFCHEDCPTGTFRSVTTPCCWKCLRCPTGTISSQINDMNCTECPQGQTPDESRSECLDLPEIEIKWSSLASVLVILFAVIGFLLVAICSFILYKHRMTPLVKASNRELSAILMFTITTSFSVSILSLAKPTDFICTLVNCVSSMVLVTFISVLVIKTMKILSAFQINVIAKRFKAFILSTKSQSLLVLLFILPQVIFLTLWVALDSPHQRRILPPVEGMILLSCSLHQSSTGLALQIVITVYISFLAVVCTFYAFKARSLPENFNEARYIGFAMYILLLSSVGYLPINIGLYGSYATNLKCAMTLLSCYGILTCMFFPKIYVIILKPEQNTHQAVSSQVSEFSFNNFFRGKVTTVSPQKPDLVSHQKQSHLEFASVSSLTD